MRTKIHVKIGDKVQIISGKYKGLISEIIKVFPKRGEVIVKDANIKVKHSRPKQEGETGQIIRLEKPIHSSNVMLYSDKHKKASRYYIKTLNNHQKQRILKKTKEVID